jgi:hypothetical protein
MAHKWAEGHDAYSLVNKLLDWWRKYCLLTLFQKMGFHVKEICSFIICLSQISFTGKIWFQVTSFVSLTTEVILMCSAPILAVEESALL